MPAGRVILMKVRISLLFPVPVKGTEIPAFAGMTVAA